MAIARSDNKPLVLYPARISLATNDVISDPRPPVGVPVQGIPLGIFRDVTRANSRLASAVKVLVDPPPDAGDYVEITLWLNGTQTGLPQKVVNEIMTFDLFQSDLRDGSINIIQYKLENHAGNVSESTELWALYSATLPGGNNVPGTGDHPALAISLPAELGNPPSIGKDEVDQGVLLTFDYPYRKAHDTITYEINRERFTYTVKPDEVDKPVSVLIDRAKFELVGSLENCPFSYTVVDQLLNATHQRRWSKQLRANIDIDRVTLDKPILREDPDDDMDDPTIVDLDKLQGRPLLVVIIPKAPAFQKDDDVLVTYRSSESDVDLTIPGKITASFGALLPCIVQVPNNRVIAASDLEVTFKLSRPDGKPVGLSKTATATVTGTAPAELMPPTLVAPAISPIDVLIYEDGVTVRIEHLSAINNDQARLVEVDPLPGAIPFPLVLIDQNKRAEFQLTPAFLVTRRGTSIKLKWELVRAGQPTGESLALTLVINAISENDLRLPVPTIAGETGRELKVHELAPDARVLTTRIPLKQLSHPVWVDYQGIGSDGSPVNLEVWRGEPSESAEGISVAASVAWLERIKHGTELRVECAVNLDGIKDKSTTISLPVRTYAVSALVEVRPVIIGVKDSIRENIPEGGATADSAVILSGTASAEQNIQIYDEASPIGPVIKVRSDGQWSQLIDGLTIKPYSFTAVANYGSNMVSIPPRTLRAVNYDEEKFDDCQDQTIGMGKVFETPVVIIDNNGAPLSISDIRQLFPGKIEGKALKGGTYSFGHFKIKLKKNYRRLTFWIEQSPYTQPATINLLMNQTIITTKQLPQSHTQTVQLCDITTNSNFNAITFDFTGGTVTNYQIDYIRLYT